jgi:hypothetical protein
VTVFDGSAPGGVEPEGESTHSTEDHEDGHGRVGSMRMGVRAAARGAVWSALRRFHPVLHRAGKWVLGPLELKLSTAPRTLDDRSRGYGTLLMVLAGYKLDLWPHTISRIAEYTDTDQVDVCLVCSGLAPAADELRRVAGERGWSFLHAEEDLLAHAQNLAVGCFPRAEWIAKLMALATGSSWS